MSPVSHEIRLGQPSGVPDLTDHLIHYWKMEEDTTSDRVDSVGSWNMTHTGSPARVTGKNNYANSFGSGKYLSKTGITQPAIVTTSLWLNHDGSTSWQVIGVFGTPTLSGNHYFGMSGASGGQIVVVIPEGCTGTNITSSQISSGAWHHIVVTTDTTANQIKLWIDGDHIGTQSYTGSEPSVTALWFSSGTWGDNNFIGDLDEIAMYDKELSETEIDALWNAGAGRFHPFT